PGANADMMARAYAARGMIGLRLQMQADAAKDLRRALEYAVDASYLHALGAALYALGDFAGAEDVERRSVELAPKSARYRWAYAPTLVELGRMAEARVHAEAALALAPDDAALRARVTRVLGEPTERR